MINDTLNLRSGVGPGKDNFDDDAQQMRSRLTELSFEPPRRTRDALASQITDFQAESDLAVDGVVKPGGKTEQKVNTGLARKRDRDRRTLGGMLGDADIENPVGTLAAGRRNRRQDLVKTADALNKVGQPLQIAPGATTTQRGNTVAAALRKFQRNVGLKPDGVMLPGGPTQAVLRDKLAENGLAAPPPEVVEGGTEPPPPRSAGKAVRLPAGPENPATNDVAKDVAGLSLFERDGILTASGLTYEPDAMGRIGQGRWLDTNGDVVGQARISNLLAGAVERRNRLQPSTVTGNETGTAGRALMREAGFSYDAGRGLWVSKDGETLTGIEAETMLELARQRADDVLAGRARIEDMRAGANSFAPAIAVPVVIIGGLAIIAIFLAERAMRKTLEDVRRHQRRKGAERRAETRDTIPSSPPPLEPRKVETGPLPGPDPDARPKLPARLQGRPIIPPDMPPTPGFEPADIPNLIEILPDDREKLPQFIILETNPDGRLGKPETRKTLIAINKETILAAKKIALGFKHISGGGKPEQKLEQRDGASTYNFPDDEIEYKPTKRKLFINTVTTLADGQTLTIKEFNSGVNLVYNKGDGNFLLIIPKFRVEAFDRSEFRRFIRPILEEMTRPVPLDGRGRAIMKDRLVFEWRNH